MRAACKLVYTSSQYLSVSTFHEKIKLKNKKKKTGIAYFPFREFLNAEFNSNSNFVKIRRNIFTSFTRL